MDARRRSLVALFVGAALAGAAGSALAQRRPNLTPEERERLREDLNSARRDLYRNRGAQQPQQMPPPQRRPGGRLTPEEREQLRRDIMDANRNMRHRR
ncbi:MAG TPA: hypothetical protein VEG36_00515 [Burkholderiales bacterium]|nr:hypothetical protein [Burkholderiales bacterium]